jgi:biopolymer transport protein ExbD
VLKLQHSGKLLRLPLTPLIDVVFILLLFFMLSSTFAQQRQLSMPTNPTGTNSESTDKEPPVALLVDAEQAWQISGQRYSKSDPERARLLAQWKDTETEVRVTAMSEANMQDLVSTLDALSKAGLQSFTLTQSRP